MKRRQFVTNTIASLGMTPSAPDDGKQPDNPGASPDKQFAAGAVSARECGWLLWAGWNAIPGGANFYKYTLYNNVILVHGLALIKNKEGISVAQFHQGKAAVGDMYDNTVKIGPLPVRLNLQANALIVKLEQLDSTNTRAESNLDDESVHISVGYDNKQKSLENNLPGKLREKILQNACHH